MFCTIKSESKYLKVKRIQFFLTWFKVPMKLISINLKWSIAMICYNKPALCNQPFFALYIPVREISCLSLSLSLYISLSPLSLSLFLSLSLISPSLSKSLLLPFFLSLSLCLLYIILFCVSNGRFRPCSLYNP